MSKENTNTYTKRSIAPCNHEVLSDFITNLSTTHISTHKLSEYGLLQFAKMEEPTEIASEEEQTTISEKCFTPRVQKPTEWILTHLAIRCIRTIQNKTKMRFKEKSDDNVKEEEMGETSEHSQCFAAKKDGNRCQAKPKKGMKLCSKHLTNKIIKWEEEKEESCTSSTTLSQNYLRASLNGIFYLPGTSYRLDKDQYVISKDTFLSADKFDVTMNPLTEQDIAYLTAKGKKYRVIDWEKRVIQDIPKEEILKGFTIPNVPETKIRKEKVRLKPIGEDSDVEEPNIPEEVYDQLKDWQI